MARNKNKISIFEETEERKSVMDCRDAFWPRF